MRHCEYKGFQILVHAAAGLVGGYVASVTLTRKIPVPSESKFDLPVVEDLGSEDDPARSDAVWARIG